MSRRGRGLLVGITAAWALFLTAPGQAVQAAEGVAVHGQTTYRVRPAERVVHVVIDLAVTNVTPDTARVRYYYTGYALAIHRNATRVRATRAGTRLPVRLVKRERVLEARIGFGRRVFRGSSAFVRLEYDLPDDRSGDRQETRVGRAFAAFYGYAFGEERANVRIVLPPGYRATTEGEELRRDATPAGGTVLSATDIRDPRRWAVWVAADRPTALRTIEFDVVIDGRPEPVTIRAWPEDAEWAATVQDRLRRGLPALAALIGLEWPVEGDLEVRQVFSPLLGGYAGFYRVDGDEIHISDDLDEHVILHEASHAWFNGALFTERWANEGLADEYAARALAALGSMGQAPRTVERNAPGAFPLNQWPRPRRIEDERTDEQEAYGYDASWLVVRRLVDEVGPERMKEVFRAARGGEIAYRGEPAPERLARARDWRFLLDLLEERAGSRRASGLFEMWVVTDPQRLELSERRDARARHAELLRQAGGWQTPYAIRRALASWRFDEAERLMGRAGTLLERRARVEALTAALGLRPTAALERAYESSPEDFAAATRLTDEQLAALEALDRARRVQDAERDPLAVIGLYGTSPEAHFEAAKAAFAADDLVRTRDLADAAADAIDGAAEAGAERVRFAAAGGGLILVAVGGPALLWRRRRRTPARHPAADARPSPDGQGGSPVAQGPAATLAAESHEGRPTDVPATTTAPSRGPDREGPASP